MSSKDARLNFLNQKCVACILQQQQSSGQEIDYSKCKRCKIGQEIHTLDMEEWIEIDWNSTNWKDLYGN